MIEPLVLGLVVGIGSMVLLGIRRIAWRYAVLVGAGTGLVFAQLPCWQSVPPGVAVLLAAIGGALAGIAFERGERDRELRVGTILGRQASTR